MEKIWTVIAFYLCSLGSAVEINEDFQFPFQDPELGWNERVDDLVERLTLAEIVPQTITRYGYPSPAIPRLGIHQYVWITECLRGQQRTDSTSYPQALGLSSAFSPELIYNVTEAIAVEVRAQWNNNVKLGVYKTFMGLTCFSPVINIGRDPRWGRIQESYGEDPYLAGILSQQFVKGLQGTNRRYIRAAAGCKHFDAYGGPETIPVSRHEFNAKVSMTDWRMTYMPAFKMCVEAGTYNIMCSYNSVNGIPACVHKFMLKDVLRHEWGFKGYVISDAWALTDVIDHHKYINNEIDTAVAGIKAGCNLELGSSIYNYTLHAVVEGKLTERELRENIKPILYTRMRLGEFDPPSLNPYSRIGTDMIQSKTHRQLAAKAAKMSFVLLKNDNGFLPLMEKVNKVAIVGPMANNTEGIFGSYTSDVNEQYTTTPWDALRNLGEIAALAPGCFDPKCETTLLEDVTRAVIGSDVTVVCLGTGTTVESEDIDRVDLQLPGKQLELLQTVTEAANGSPVLLILFNGGALDISWAKWHPGVQGILEAGFPAQATGEALFDIITMHDGSVPAGRLTTTWPAGAKQLPPITNYGMEGRTYRYFDGDPLYPFGYGLSYTTFRYWGMRLFTYNVEVGQNVEFSVTLENTGGIDADEVIQIYLQWDTPGLPAPKLQLVGFKRIHLPAGERDTVYFIIKGQQMELWFEDINDFNVVPGPMTVYAGGQQPNQKTSISSNVLSAQFEIVPINPLLYKFTYPRPWKRALFWFCVCILAFLLILVVSQTIQNRQIRLSPKVIYRDLWGTVRTAFLSSIDKLRKVNSKESKGPTI